jgi:Domain of unknown function (DUF3854)
MTLLPEHIADLRRSGLSDETILNMNVSSIGADDLDRRFKLAGVQSALRFEYLQLNGFSPFYRDKLFPPMSKDDGGVQRYHQPGEKGCRLYVPESVIDIFHDKNHPLLIAEGEKKAWAGVQAGLPTVAIGGVWNFVDKNTDWLLPELDEVLKPGRVITYTPDSDVWIRQDLLKAVFELGSKIELRTGKFYLIKLPVGPGGSKVGLDDFLVAYGVEEFEKLKRYTLKDGAFTSFRKQQAFRKEVYTEPPPQKPVEISDADRAEALSLLQDPDLLQRFLDDIQTAGCVGEEDNKIILFLAYTSRRLNHPINLNVKGESSAGKNYLVQSVGRFFPPEEVHFISSATPKALFYLGADLSHRVVVIAEAPGAEDAQYSIRTMQSENELTILVPEKVDGRIETRERKVKGPVAFIETTTRAHLHNENENRCFDIYIDESEGQTKKIFRAQDRGFLGLVNMATAALKVNVWQNAQRLLDSMPVVVDYARFIKFPPKPLRVRRDRPRFMALIEACALLHQHQRAKRDIHGVSHIVASPDDYEVVKELSGAILGRVLSGVTPSCEKMVQAVSGFGGEFTQLDVAREMQWSRPTTIKYCKEAVSLGCLEVMEGGRGKTYKYRFVRLADSIEVLLPTKEQILNRLEGRKKRFTRFADYLKAKKAGNL